MSRWGEIDTWTGNGIRREVFFFRCDGIELYGSLYAAEPATSRVGAVFCNSWGIEADRANRLVHPLALWMAQAGGAGLVFNSPGAGDSQGEPEEVTMAAMAAAAAAALREGERRAPESEWVLAGLMLGASVASLALTEVAPEAVLLVQPALRPSEYFAEVEHRARRIARLTNAGEETVFGYSPSAALLASASAADAQVGAALGGFKGRGAVVRYSPPKGTNEVPERFERVEVEGTWRFAAQDNSRLRRAARSWLRGYMRKRG